MKIILRNTTNTPIYEQIREQIKQAIFSGELAEGEALPSIRQLARDLKVSVITTTRAYSDLEQEGFVASVQGKGFFVLPKDSQLVREQALVAIEEHFEQAAFIARRAAISPQELGLIFQNILEDPT